MEKQEPLVYQLPDNTGQAVRKMLIWLSVSLGILLVIVALVVLNAHKIAKHIPFEAEQRFVGPYERLIREHYKGDLNPKMDAYLQYLADNLAGGMDVHEEIVIKMHYVESKPQNAFATLGGHIFVFCGLIEMMPDENSLAMVIAHEIAHIKNRDPAASMGQGFAISLIYSFVLSDGVRSEDLADLSANLGLSVFSRKQEEAADLAAIDGLVAYYGHAAGYDQFFTQMKGVAQEGGALDYPEWLSSHPDLEQRITYLKSYVDAKDYKVGEAKQISAVVKHEMSLGLDFENSLEK